MIFTRRARPGPMISCFGRTVKCSASESPLETALTESSSRLLETLRTVITRVACQ